MTLQIPSNRVVSASCTLRDGRRIDVGRFIDTGKAFITRYDICGVPTDHSTYDSNYVFSAVTISTDIRRDSIDIEDINASEQNIFVAGNYTDEAGVIHPLIVHFFPDTELASAYVGQERGYLSGIIMDQEGNYCSIYGCGTILNEHGHVVEGILIKDPLYGPEDSSRENYTNRTVLYHHGSETPSSFRSIALDAVGFVICVGFNHNNSSDTDFDYIVKYHPGSENVDDEEPFRLVEIMTV